MSNKSNFQALPNTGSVFENKKEKEGNHPDWTGNGNYNGEEFQMALWKKTAKSGKEYYFVKFSPPMNKTDGGSGAPNVPAPETKDTRLNPFEGFDD